MLSKYIYFVIFIFLGVNATAQSLVTGKASLEKTEKQVYTITMDNGVSKTIDLNAENQNSIKGILAVLFGDCGTMRDEIFATEYFSEKTLIKYVNSYNSCDYSKYAPTEKELEKVNSNEIDIVKFYGGFGVGLKNISFFDNTNKETLNQYGATIGIMATPSFVGVLQGNLYFSFQASMSFGGEKTFINAPSATSFSANTYRLMLGTEYYFNKNGKIKPFLGVAIGLTGDNYKGNVTDFPFKISGGDPIWMPKIGLLYSLGSGKDIGVTVDYIPEYENDLSFPNGDVIIPLIVKSSYFNFGLNFYF